ncbi:hypothetical protein V5F53_21740, partial [Xanthobacter sp. V4C-4]
MISRAAGTREAGRRAAGRLAMLLAMLLAGLGPVRAGEAAGRPPAGAWAGREGTGKAPRRPVADAFALYAQGDAAAAARQLAPLAEAGNARAQALLGFLYEKGHG